MTTTEQQDMIEQLENGTLNIYDIDPTLLIDLDPETEDYLLSVHDSEAESSERAADQMIYNRNASDHAHRLDFDDGEGRIY